MTPRRLLALVVLLVLVAGAAALVWRAEQPVTAGANPLAKIDAARIDRIQIVSKSTTTLVQSGGRWRLESPVVDAADAAAVGRLVTGLRTFTFGSVVSENKAKHGQFSVDDATGARLTVMTAGGKTPTLDLIVGKPTADLESSFVRAPDEDKVRTADGLSSFLVRDDPSRLRDPAVVPFPFENLTSLSATWKKGGVTLARSSASWTVNGKTPLADDKISALRARLAGLRATDFGLATNVPDVAATVEFSSGTARVRVAFGQPPAKGMETRVVSVEGRPTVLLVPESSAKDFLAFLASLH